jgi:hypothetical protein
VRWVQTTSESRKCALLTDFIFNFGMTLCSRVVSLAGEIGPEVPGVMRGLTAQWSSPQALVLRTLPT